MDKDRVIAAINVLELSGRGREALDALAELLNGDALTGLDARNQQALIDVIQGVWGPYSGTVIELVRDRHILA